jgi:hypothetical protein
MKESRKVILVMSNAFARSEWCQFEVLLARDRFLKNIAMATRREQEITTMMVTVELRLSVQSSLNVVNSFPFQYSGITQ